MQNGNEVGNFHMNSAAGLVQNGGTMPVIIFMNVPAVSFMFNKRRPISRIL